MRHTPVFNLWVPCASLHPTYLFRLMLFWSICPLFSFPFIAFAMLFLELLLEPCRYPSDIFLSSRPRTRLATAYIRPLGMVEARWVNVKNTHTHKHTPSMRVAYKDKNDRTGLRGYVQFNKHTHTHTDDARYICCCDNKHRYI